MQDLSYGLDLPYLPDISGITGLTQDSRAVRSGYLFAALPGTKTDGRDYIAQAIQAGARMILAPRGTALPDEAAGEQSGVTLITDDNPKRLFSLLAAAYYGAQPRQCVAVTGTNGKTSTVYFTQQIWAALGVQSAGIGTLGVKLARAGKASDGAGFGDFPSSAGGSSMTTPDPVALHRDLAALQQNGVEYLAMEASSHGLDQYRLDGVRIRAAGFTSFSRDHLDYHKTDDAYLLAKMRLFSEVCESGGVAVLNADIPQYDALAAAARAHGLNVRDYGRKGYDLQIIGLETVPQGIHIRLRVAGERYEFVMNLAGEFQAYNALCALGLVLAEDGVNPALAVRALSDLSSVPGRLQRVSGHPRGAGVYVDYAHTPDAIETVLKALRPHTDGKLVCIFGCGGDRDTGKRPLMGRAAAEYADIAIVTDDNPRSEDPASIRAQAASASPDIVNIGGRRDAIRTALSMLKTGDVLAITGKGHEQGQQFADHTEDFCDVAVTQDLIAQME